MSVDSSLSYLDLRLVVFVMGELPSGIVGLVQPLVTADGNQVPVQMGFHLTEDFGGVISVFDGD